MKVDTIKAGFTFLTAYTIIVGGLYIIYATRLDPVEARGGIQLLIGGFIGAAITFLFNSETATRATAAAASSTAAGVALSPTVTTTSGPPASVTVTPPTPMETDPLGADSEEPFGDAIG